MPDISAMKELLARVESATGADSELDEAIMALFYERRRKFIGVTYVGGGRAMSMVWVDPTTCKWVSTHSFEFTASLDRCVALIEKVLPGWNLTLEIHPAATAVGLYSPAWPEGDNADSEGNAPPLALLAATLRALLQIEERKAGGEPHVG